MLIINTIIFLAVLLCLSELFSRNHRVSWITFSAMPFILLPWWAIYTESVPFVWVKIYSVTLGITMIMAFRLTSIREKKWPRRVVAMILVVNILEAVIQDVLVGSYMNYMSAAAGILLIVTMPKSDLIAIDSESPASNLVWDIPLFWIIGYTLWNMNFVNLHWPTYVLLHVSILGAPLIIGLVNNRLWFQARAFTLGTFLMVNFTYPPILDPLLTEAGLIESIALACGSISLVWMLVYALRMGKSWLQSRGTEGLEYQYQVGQN